MPTLLCMQELNRLEYVALTGCISAPSTTWKQLVSWYSMTASRTQAMSLVRILMIEAN